MEKVNDSSKILSELNDKQKEELFIVSEIGNESQFIEELPEEFLEKNNFIVLNFQNKINFTCKNCKFSSESKCNFCPNCGEKNISYHAKLYLH